MASMRGEPARLQRDRRTDGEQRRSYAHDEGVLHVVDPGDVVVVRTPLLAQSYGLRPVGLYNGNAIARWSLDDLRAELRAGHPVIVQVRFRSLPGRARVAYFGDHYIILTGLSGENFVYNDPLPSDGAGPNRLMTPSQLSTAMSASDSRFAYAGFALTR